jgi:hypothetical protein
MLFERRLFNITKKKRFQPWQGKNEMKEMFAGEILKMVDIEVVRKDGKLYKPHNKMIDKKEPVLERKKGGKAYRV